ncbi:DUF4082 domain-containing protein [Streptomycetaceae bacterium NBC_01309]
MAEHSIWGATGGNSNADNGSAVSLGTKIRTSTTVPLWVMGIRYFRGTVSAGTKTGRVFRTGDQAVISEVVTFTDSGTGWQEKRLLLPVALATNTLYTPAVLFPSGEPSFTGGYFGPGGGGSAGVVSGPITAPNNADAPGQAVFQGGGTLVCPGSSFNSTSYWVDWIVSDVNPFAIILNGIPPTVTIGQPALSPGAATISLSGIASALTVGQPSLTVSASTINLNGIPSAASIGQPALLPGAATISLDGIAANTTFGQPSLSAGPATITLDGIPSAATVGQPDLLPGPAGITLDGIASTASLGEPALTPGAATISLAGIPSAASIGQPALLPGPASIALTGVPSALTVGQPWLSDPEVADPDWDFALGPPYTDSFALGPPHD